MTGTHRNTWAADLLTGLAVYALTTLPVALGLGLALAPGVFTGGGPDPDLPSRCCSYDGEHYQSIVTGGYSFDPGRESNVAFFPGYPLLAGLVVRLTGWRADVALVVTANAALVAALALLSAYLRSRGEPPTARLATLAAVGLWPVAFFFRMGYSEGLFLALLALLLLGLTRRWPVALLAVIAGAATGVRPVGVAAAAAVAAHVLVDPARGPARRLAVAAAVLLLGCWGLLAYMGYQYDRFGTPTAFAQTQRHWAFFKPDPPHPAFKWVRLATGEPVWAAYIPGSGRFWTVHDRSDTPGVGVGFWNPTLFVLAAAAVGVGRFRGWLTGPETVLGAALLLIPYVTRADETCMGSHARFASVAIPAHLVIGRALGRLPPAAGWAAFAAMSPLLAAGAALFAAGWPLT